MAIVAPKTAASKKPQKAPETSESIQAQITAFLNAGGKINVIDNGVSGREFTKNSKQITINPKQKKD